MKASRFLLASVDIPPTKEGKKSATTAATDGNESDEDFDGSIKQYQLALPSQIVIVSNLRHWA
jgi:hypothetical protein